MEIEIGGEARRIGRQAECALTALGLFALMAGCGGGGGGGDAGGGSAPTFAIGGSVSGLSGTVVLQNNGGDNLSVSVNGTFTFSAVLADGASYSVAVLTQPAGQICSVANGAGTVSSANVTNMTVVCANVYTVGGTVSGLTGTVVLRNNGANDLTLSANGPFTFSAAVANGGAYAVSVFTQSASQVCSVADGTGTIAGANVTNVAITCGALYFAASDGVSGTELWKTNGTNAGTVRVKDISPGGSGSGSSPFGLTVFNGALYFAASDGVSGSELWKTDGTDAGTVRVKDINPGVSDSFPDASIVFNGALYFRAFDAAAGYELWKTDGTEAGTVRVKDINPGAESALPLFPAFAVLNEALYFAARDEAAGFELWKTDGTDAGTVRVMDINPGTNSSFQPFAFGLIAFNGALYFSAQDGVSGFELWKSDGTEAGTVRVKDINLNLGGGSSSPAGFTVFNGALYFWAGDGVLGVELWKTDGTEAGTVCVKDINPGAGSSTNISPGFTVFNNALYFSADDGVLGVELWKSDGTEAGTVLVKDINPGVAASAPFGFTILNGTLYFVANDGVSGAELWKSDGTEAGTARVRDIRPGVNSSIVSLGGPPPGLTVFNGALYFAAHDGVSGAELWKSDGTGAGTVRVKDINPGALDLMDPFAGNSFPSGLTPF